MLLSGSWGWRGVFPEPQMYNAPAPDKQFYLGDSLPLHTGEFVPKSSEGPKPKDKDKCGTEEKLLLEYFHLESAKVTLLHFMF